MASVRIAQQDAVLPHHVRCAQCVVIGGSLLPTDDPATAFSYSRHVLRPPSLIAKVLVPALRSEPEQAHEHRMSPYNDEYLVLRRRDRAWMQTSQSIHAAKWKKTPLSKSGTLVFGHTVVAM